MTPYPPNRRCGVPARGVTLIELMVAIAVLAIIAALAVPSFRDFRERSVVRGAAEDLVGQIANYRFEAVRRNRALNLSFGGTPPTAAWCMGAVVGSAACDCATGSPACAAGTFPGDGATSLRGARLIDRSGFGLGQSFTFDPSTGTLISAGDAGSVTIASPTAALNYQLRVDVNALGRVSVCIPAGARALPGYQAC